MKEKSKEHGKHMLKKKRVHNRYIQAQDIVDYLATPEVQAKLGTKVQGIHLRDCIKCLELSWVSGCQMIMIFLYNIMSKLAIVWNVVLPFEFFHFPIF